VNNLIRAIFLPEESVISGVFRPHPNPAEHGFNVGRKPDFSLSEFDYYGWQGV
jgi:hypothetical protein